MRQQFLKILKMIYKARRSLVMRYYFGGSIANYLNYHCKVRNREHVFLYSVCGRSSSTALQRILNSTNEICVYGEHHKVIDMALELLDLMSVRNEIAKEKNQYENLEDCFFHGKHNSWYANAINDLSLNLKLVEAMMSSILFPVNFVGKFGFKEIGVSSKKTIELIKCLYPNCFIVFMFRNPIYQWVSIKNYMISDYKNSIEYYIDEYRRLSGIYIDSFQEGGKNIFVENMSLTDDAFVEKLMNCLNLRGFDRELLQVKINSASGEISDQEKEKILRSGAMDSYYTMKTYAQKIRP